MISLSSGRFDAPSLALLLIAAVALRAGVLWKFGDNLANDPDNYRRIAARVAAGDGFVDPDTLTPTAYRPPLYPLLLAGILFGGGGNTAIGVVQLLLGTATVALTVLCGRRLGLGRASLVAGLLVAVDPLLLQQTTLVMTETLATFLAVLLLWLSLGESSPTRNFAVGLVFGLSCLCRPTFWAFGVLAAAVWLVTRLRSRSGTDKWPVALWRPAVSVVAGILMVVAPWVIRNAASMGRPIATTTHGGYTLLLPHNPAYTRAVVDQPWGAVWEGRAYDEWYDSLEIELARETPPLDKSHFSPTMELARDAWMNRKAGDYIRSEPVTALKAGLTLLSRFWGIVPLATKDRPLAALLRPAIGTFYVLTLGTMLIGLVRAIRTEWRRWWPLAALLVAFTLVHAIYWADMRMRTPLVPAIALLAAAACTTGRRSWRSPV